MVLFITLCKVTALSHEFLDESENLQFEEGLIERGGGGLNTSAVCFSILILRVQLLKYLVW